MYLLLWKKKWVSFSVLMGIFMEFINLVKMWIFDVRFNLMYIFVVSFIMCVYFWPFGYVKDLVLRFAFHIVGSFMVFCFDFLVRKKIDTKFTAKSISWMICRMRIKLRVPFTFIFLNFLFQNTIIKFFFFFYPLPSLNGLLY